MNGIGPPHFEIGQAVLVDQGLPGEITAVKRGTVRGVLDLPPRNTWLYRSSPKRVATLRPMSPSTTWWPRQTRENLQSDRSNLSISVSTTATSSTPCETQDEPDSTDHRQADLATAVALRRQSAGIACQHSR